MFKRKPISCEASPKDQLDLIDYQVWNVLFYIKIALIVLITYLFVLTISEGFYLFRDAKEGRYGKIYIKPKGGTEKLWQYPKKTINVVGVDVKNFGFKKQTNTLTLFVVDANVTEEL